MVGCDMILISMILNKTPNVSCSWFLAVSLDQMIFMGSSIFWHAVTLWLCYRNALDWLILVVSHRESLHSGNTINWCERQLWSNRTIREVRIWRYNFNLNSVTLTPYVTRLWALELERPGSNASFDTLLSLWPWWIRSWSSVPHL